MVTQLIVRLLKALNKMINLAVKKLSRRKLSEIVRSIENIRNSYSLGPGNRYELDQYLRCDRNR